MTGDEKYIYCLIKCEGEREFAVNGIGGDGRWVYTINYSDLAAVVSELPGAKHELTPQNLKTHQLVVEEVMKEYDVLPVGFGCIAKNDAQIRDKILKAKFDHLHKLFQQMGNKIELVLKASWVNEHAVTEIASSSPQISRLRQKIANKSPGTAREEQIELGKLVMAALNKRRQKETKEILAPLQALAVDKQLNKISSTNMLFNASFLVEKSKEAEFDAQVNRLGEKYEGKIQFTYIGPLPPYDFVDIAVRLQ